MESLTDGLEAVREKQSKTATHFFDANEERLDESGERNEKAQRKRSKNNKSEVREERREEESLVADLKKIKKGEIKLVKNTAVAPGEPPTDAYLARAAALKFEFQNYHKLAAPSKRRDLAPIKR